MRMALNDAIEYTGEKSNTIEYKECADEHKQLANFLIELRLLREQY